MRNLPGLHEMQIMIKSTKSAEVVKHLTNILFV